MNEISDLVKETPETLVPSFCHVRTQEVNSLQTIRRFVVTKSCRDPDLGLAAIRTVRTSFLFFISHHSTVFYYDSLN